VKTAEFALSKFQLVISTSKFHNHYVLAGIVLWAMTTLTAALSNAKFESVLKLIQTTGNLASAWALYALWAVTAVGITAFGILHPKGCPMARGSGIPELKGYLNGNRQQGLFQWRTFAGRAIGICLVITATMPFGREAGLYKLRIQLRPIA
jgi:H+/Cl- antiporter ClcA